MLADSAVCITNLTESSHIRSVKSSTMTHYLLSVKKYIIIRSVLSGGAREGQRKVPSMTKSDLIVTNIAISVIKRVLMSVTVT